MRPAFAKSLTFGRSVYELVAFVVPFSKIISSLQDNGLRQVKARLKDDCDIPSAPKITEAEAANVLQKGAQTVSLFHEGRRVEQNCLRNNCAQHCSWAAARHYSHLSITGNKLRVFVRVDEIFCNWWSLFQTIGAVRNNIRTKLVACSFL